MNKNTEKVTVYLVSGIILHFGALLINVFFFLILNFKSRPADGEPLFGNIFFLFLSLTFLICGIFLASDSRLSRIRTLPHLIVPASALLSLSFFPISGLESTLNLQTILMLVAVSYYGCLLESRRHQTGKILISLSVGILTHLLSVFAGLVVAGVISSIALGTLGAPLMFFIVLYVPFFLCGMLLTLSKDFIFPGYLVTISAFFATILLLSTLSFLESPLLFISVFWSFLGCQFARKYVSKSS
jgi:hypothetical protein